MKRTKKFLGLFLAMSLFSTTVFASTTTVRSIVRDYQVKVRVENVDSKTALKQLTDQLLKADITQAELMDYVKSTSSAEEFEQFMSIIETGNEELSNADFIDGTEFQHILGQVFANTHINMGANYNGGGQQGCTSSYFGYVFIAASVYLAIRLIQQRNSSDDVCEDSTWVEDRFDSIQLGQNLSQRQLIIGTAISGALGAYMVGRCYM